MEQDFKKHTSYIGIYTTALNQQKLMSKFDEVNAENAQLKLMFQRFSDQV